MIVSVDEYISALQSIERIVDAGSDIGTSWELVSNHSGLSVEDIKDLYYIGQEDKGLPSFSDMMKLATEDRNDLLGSLRLRSQINELIEVPSDKKSLVNAARDRMLLDLAREQAISAFAASETMMLAASQIAEQVRDGMLDKDYRQRPAEGLRALERINKLHNANMRGVKDLLDASHKNWQANPPVDRKARGSMAAEDAVGILLSALSVLPPDAITAAINLHQSPALEDKSGDDDG